jgi:hypothetical protein
LSALRSPSESVAPTRAASEIFISTSAASPLAAKTVWTTLIDRLDDWDRSPNAIDEDDWESPSIPAITTAFRLLRTLRDGQFAPPSRVVPNGEGGILFILDSTVQSETYEIDENGSLEYRLYIGDRLDKRETVLIV